MIKIVKYVLLIIVLVLIGVFAVSITGLFSLADNDIKIGVMLPLTGDAASWGEPAKEALLLAEHEYNDLHNPDVQLIFEDDKCNASDSVAGANKLTNVDDVIGVIGFACSGAAKAAIPIFDSAKKPLIIVAASNPDLTKMSDFVFRVHPSDSEQGKFAANYIYTTLHKNKVALLYENESWGKGITNVFKNSYNGQIILDESFNTDAKDLTTELAKVKNSGADIIYFIAHPEPAINALTQMKRQNINTQLFGGDSFETDELKSLPEAKGVIYALAQISTPDSFKQKLKEFSDYEKGDFITATLAYDAFWILTNAINKANSSNGKDIVAELKKTNYRGVSNPQITFNEFGDIASANFEIKTIN